MPSSRTRLTSEKFVLPESLSKEFQNKKVVIGAQGLNYYGIFTHQGHIKKVVTVTECFWRKKWQRAHNIKPFLVVLFLLVGLVVLMSNEYGFQFLPNFDLPSKRQWTLNIEQVLMATTPWIEPLYCSFALASMERK